VGSFRSGLLKMNDHERLSDLELGVNGSRVGPRKIGGLRLYTRWHPLDTSDNAARAQSTSACFALANLSWMARYISSTFLNILFLYSPIVAIAIDLCFPLSLELYFENI